MNATPSSSAVRALSLEYKSLQEEPVEGFRVKLLNEDNLFEWEVAIFGPPDTLYQGGYFKVRFSVSSINHRLGRFDREPARANANNHAPMIEQMSGVGLTETTLAGARQRRCVTKVV
uniref:UBIQUITIN_CONJUGAT_2 domain-containing protein n=1 Tax=Anopheles maculatus TaxID=74869 RepID=A0A182SBF4_9DIPT